MSDLDVFNPPKGKEDDMVIPPLGEGEMYPEMVKHHVYKINSQEEFDKLPTGALFTRPGVDTIFNKKAPEKPRITAADGLQVPGPPQGDKEPIMAEGGEFIVSNDMMDQNPGLREHLHSIHQETLGDVSVPQSPKSNNGWSQQVNQWGKAYGWDKSAPESGVTSDPMPHNGWQQQMNQWGNPFGWQQAPPEASPYQPSSVTYQDPEMPHFQDGGQVGGYDGRHFQKGGQNGPSKQQMLQWHQMAYNSAKEAGLDPKLMWAIFQQETGHGKSSDWRRYGNPGGIGGPGAGPSRVYGQAGNPDFQQGFNAMASLIKRKYGGANANPRAMANRWVGMSPSANADWVSQVTQLMNQGGRGGGQPTSSPTGNPIFKFSYQGGGSGGMPSQGLDPTYGGGGGNQWSNQDWHDVFGGNSEIPWNEQTGEPIYQPNNPEGSQNSPSFQNPAPSEGNQFPTGDENYYSYDPNADPSAGAPNSGGIASGDMSGQPDWGDLSKGERKAFKAEHGGSGAMSSWADYYAASGAAGKAYSMSINPSWNSNPYGGKAGTGSGAYSWAPGGGYGSNMQGGFSGGQWANMASQQAAQQGMAFASDLSGQGLTHSSEGPINKWADGNREQAGATNPRMRGMIGTGGRGGQGGRAPWYISTPNNPINYRADSGSGPTGQKLTPEEHRWLANGGVNSGQPGPGIFGKGGFNLGGYIPNMLPGKGNVPGSGNPTQNFIGSVAGLAGNLFFPGLGIVTGALAKFITRRIQQGTPHDQIFQNAKAQGLITKDTAPQWGGGGWPITEGPTAHPREPREPHPNRFTGGTPLLNPPPTDPSFGQSTNAQGKAFGWSQNPTYAPLATSPTPQTTPPAMGQQTNQYGKKFGWGPT